MRTDAVCFRAPRVQFQLSSTVALPYTDVTTFEAFSLCKSTITATPNGVAQLRLSILSCSSIEERAPLRNYCFQLSNIDRIV